MGKNKEDFMLDRQADEKEPKAQPDDITRHLSSLVTTDKSGITALAQNIVNQVEIGISDPIRSFSSAKKLSELADLVMKNLRPKLLDSLKIGKNEVFVKDNVEFTQAETGVSYNYASCEDLTYNEIMTRFTAVSAEKKAREDFLKTIVRDTGAFDVDSGESWTIHPPVRSGTLGVKTELKNN